MFAKAFLVPGISDLPKEVHDLVFKAIEEKWNLIYAQEKEKLTSKALLSGEAYV